MNRNSRAFKMLEALNSQQRKKIANFKANKAYKICSKREDDADYIPSEDTSFTTKNNTEGNINSTDMEDMDDSDAVPEPNVSPTNLRDDMNITKSINAENSTNQVKNKINIISDITIIKNTESFPSNDNSNAENVIADVQITQGDVATFIDNILTGVLTDVLQISNTKTYTKKGELRKRKIYDKSVSERKRIKLEKKVKDHGVKQRCTKMCKIKCINKISERRRININEEFWKLQPAEQRNFVINNLSQTGVKRRTAGDPLRGSRRSKTVVYFLKDEDGAKQNVCKTFFLGTLGYETKNDRFVRDVLNNSTNAGLTPNPNKRGKHSRVKIDRDIIINHIESFKPTVAHYRREHALKRKYLPSDITIQLMYDNFKTKYPHIQFSYYLYREVVTSLNISFVKLGHEETQILLEVQILSSPLTFKRSSCSRAIFTPRIIAFNESFVPVGAKQSGPTAVLWHEAVNGRSKEDLISTYYAFFLSARDKKNIVLWLDNCSAQNKNWCLFTFFVYIVNSNEVLLESLVVKYFEPGHTFMAADSFHHNVEKSLKRAGKVYDFQDFVSAVRISTKNVNIIEMQIEWKYGTSQYKLNKISPRPYLKNMVEVSFYREQKTLIYKSSFADKGRELNFLNAKLTKQGISKPSSKQGPTGITRERKTLILEKLCPIMPQNRKAFWENLPTCSGTAATSNEDSTDEA